ncbi:MAG: cytochrome c peroxidase [Bryobacteraceae bacterium]
MPKICLGFAIAISILPLAAETAVDAASLKLFKPLPQTIPGPAGKISEEQVSLGRMLFYDVRFSKSQKISCNSCRDLATYGVDHQATSTGYPGQKGGRNAPTVSNAAGHFSQFWDGRAKDVEEQAKGPVLNPIEMAMGTNKDVLAVLKSIPEYVAAFKKAFPGDADPMTYDNFGRAIGAFERKLVTPGRWDKFLNGDKTALNDAEKAGLNTFVATGCVNCHNGADLGAERFQKMGAAKAWPDASDNGRAQVTHSDSDRLMFKVPSLRNIEKTGPYFHNGKTATLQTAIQDMAEFQLGKSLTPVQTASIETFLKTLIGEIPAELVKKPALPPSTASTPKASEAK